MITHVGIIDQDPVRLITPLLDEAVPADKMVFIGTLDAVGFLFGFLGNLYVT